MLVENFDWREEYEKGYTYCEGGMLNEIISLFTFTGFVALMLW